MLGTGHYSSPVGGVGEEGVWGHLSFGRTKGGIISNWEPKRGDRWKIWKDSEGGTTQICLENEGMVGGSRKSSKVIRGDHFTEETVKGGIG